MSGFSLDIFNNGEDDYVNIDENMLGEEDSENRHDAQCRVCLENCVQNESHNLTSKYSDSLEHGNSAISIVNLISKIAHIQLLTNDSFPNYLCGDCFHNMTVAYSFVQKVIESEEKLRARVQNENLELDNNCLLHEIGEAADDKQCAELENYHSSQTEIDKRDIGCGTTDDFSYNQQNSPSHQTMDCDITTIKEEPMDPDEIKQEKPDYNEDDYDVDEVDACPKSTNEFQLGQISIEPLSFDAALKIHHQNINQAETTQNCITQNGKFNSESEDDDDENEDEIQPTEADLKEYEVEYLDTSDMCGNNLESLSNAAFIHKNIHTCILCNQKYRSKKGLKYHVEYFHTYCDPIKCEFCEALFNNLGDYSLHKNSHSVNTRISKLVYTCDICDENNFVSEDDFNNHVYAHNLDTVKNEQETKVDNLQNDEISAQYKSTSSELNAPEDIFRNNVSLEVITNVVNEENPWKCPNCPSAFSFEYEKLNHMYKCCPTTCAICNQYFTQKQQLSLHYQTEHADVFKKKI